MKAEAGSGTTSQRAERLLIQHSSSSDLCVYQMRSAEAGFIESASHISLQTGVWSMQTSGSVIYCARPALTEAF